MTRDGSTPQGPSPRSAPGRLERFSGLTAAEVLTLRAQYGANRLPRQDGMSAWTILGSQFRSPLVYIILAAAGISLALGELGDFAIITAVVVVDVILGFAQEYQARRSYVALRGLLKPIATVIRDGRRQEVDVEELVPGDIALLVTGGRTPADGDLLEATRLALDEAILTGESEPVTKVAVPVEPPKGASSAGYGAEPEARRSRVS